MTRFASLALGAALILPLAAAAQAPRGTQSPARFRQGVDYRIEARLDEDTDVLAGRAELRYTNRSPRALDTLHFHQHLNAFRPNSAWARRELQFGNRRFQELGPAEHAFERFGIIEVDGRAVRPVYLNAPDSTVVAVPLPVPLRPGQTATLRLDWTARLSTLPRRQGRRGRHFDWAHWYPRIAVYEARGWATQPLLPQGEFYGEFARYDVTLDLAEDQVIGATGVPVEGDPGWNRNGDPVTDDHLMRSAYPASPTRPLGLLAGSTGAGRKRVRWRADQVHHFAWSADPDYTHEPARRLVLSEDLARTEQDVGVNVLYLPGDTAWDEGVVARRAVGALRWMEELFGPYPYPQLTVVHRLESGGTEFPMLVMNGSPSEGLVVHEVAHQWLHGILANNEWREGWLDEGFTSFVTNWYWEAKGQANVWTADLDTIAARDRSGQTQPVGLPGAAFRDPRTYSQMTYTKGALVFRMLRGLLGEPTFRRVLRTYYDRHKLGHVSGADFEAVAERVSGRELSWFFRQWLQTTATLDYAVAGARTERLPSGRYRTRIEVTRQGEAWMPVALQVGDATRTLTGRARGQRVEVVTANRPTEVVLDPERLLLDLDPSNNRRALP